MNFETAQFENVNRLRTHYRAAFAQWAEQLVRVKAEAASSTGVSHEAMDRASLAEASYRASRDRLATEMMR